jgi:hypothetical protein
LWPSPLPCELGLILSGLNSPRLAAKSFFSLRLNTPLLAAGYFICAWHDADADLLAEKPEVKRPPRFIGEGQRQQGKGRFQKWAVRRKHEAEPMYVADSESR